MGVSIVHFIPTWTTECVLTFKDFLRASMVQALFRNIRVNWTGKVPFRGSFQVSGKDKQAITVNFVLGELWEPGKGN